MESHGGSKKIIKREKGFCLENVMMMVIGWSKIFSGFAFLMDEKQKEHKAKKTDWRKQTVDSCALVPCDVWNKREK